MFPSIYYQPYIISLPKRWFLRDEPAENVYFPSQEKITDHAGLLFHVSKDDYFSTLATILRFYEESIYDNPITEEMRELQLKTIKSVMNDLLFLDKHYRIVQKDKEILNERIHQKFKN